MHEGRNPAPNEATARKRSGRSSGLDPDAAVEFEAGDEDDASNRRPPKRAPAFFSRRFPELLRETDAERGGCATTVYGSAPRSRPCIRRNAPVPRALLNAFFRNRSTDQLSRPKPTDRSVSVYALRSLKVSAGTVRRSTLRSPVHHRRLREAFATPITRVVARGQVAPEARSPATANRLAPVGRPGNRDVVDDAAHRAPVTARWSPALRRSSSRELAS